MSMSDRDTERERDRGPGTADRDRRNIRETLEDDLDLIRGAPRDRALHIMRILLEAVYGDGFIRGVEEVRPSSSASRSTGTNMTSSG